MCRAIGLDGAAVSEVIAGIGLDVEAEGPEKPILKAYAQAHRPLETRPKRVSKAADRVAAGDIFCLQRTADGQFERHAACGISHETAFFPDAIGEPKRNADIRDALRFEDGGVVELARSFRFQ